MFGVDGKSLGSFIEGPDKRLYNERANCSYRRDIRCDSEGSSGEGWDLSSDATGGQLQNNTPTEAISINRSGNRWEFDADSALGRSVSDPSLSESLSSSRKVPLDRRFMNDIDNYIASSSERISRRTPDCERFKTGRSLVDGAENLRRVETVDLMDSFGKSAKTASRYDRYEREMSAGRLFKVDNIDLTSTGDYAQTDGKQAGQDVGYSSESHHSNEEPEINQLGVVTCEKTNILDGRITEEDEPKEEDGSNTEMGKTIDTQTGSSEGETIDIVIHPPTSAYNTNSDSCGSSPGLDDSTKQSLTSTPIKTINVGGKTAICINTIANSSSCDQYEKDQSMRTEDELSESMDLPIDEVPVIVYAPGLLEKIVVPMSRSLDSLDTISDEKFLNRVDKVILKQRIRAENDKNVYREIKTSEACVKDDPDGRLADNSQTMVVPKVFVDVGVGSTMIKRTAARKDAARHAPNSCDASSEATNSGSECGASDEGSDDIQRFSKLSSASHIHRSVTTGKSSLSLRNSPEKDVVSPRTKSSIKRTRLESFSLSSGNECEYDESKTSGNLDDDENIMSKVRKTSPQSSPVSGSPRFHRAKLGVFDEVRKQRRRRQLWTDMGGKEQLHQDDSSSMDDNDVDDAQVVPMLVDVLVVTNSEGDVSQPFHNSLVGLFYVQYYVNIG